MQFKSYDSSSASKTTLKIMGESTMDTPTMKQGKTKYVYILWHQLKVCSPYQQSYGW